MADEKLTKAICDLIDAAIDVDNEYEKLHSIVQRTGATFYVISKEALVKMRKALLAIYNEVNEKEIKQDEGSLMGRS